VIHERANAHDRERKPDRQQSEELEDFHPHASGFLLFTMIVEQLKPADPALEIP
jgi:hypothetical protein